MSYRVLLTCLLISWGTLLNGQNILGDFFQGKSSYKVRFDYRQNFIIVSVKFQGFIDLNFLVDTGSEHTVLFDKSLTDLFDFKYSKKIKIIGSDQSQDINAYVVRHVRLKLKDIPERKEDLIVLEKDFFSLSQLVGKKIDGILGGSFFRNAILEIDYHKWNLYIHNASNFKKDLSEYTTHRVKMHKGKPYMALPCDFTDGTSDTMNLLLDTGASLALLFYANERTGIHVPERHIPGYIGFGLGGALKGFIGRVDRVQFGEYDFHDMISNFQVFDVDSLNTSRFRDGILGNNILSRFNVLIDYVRGNIHIKRTKKWNESFKLDRSGLVIVGQGRNFSSYVVHSVIENSPASEAGILPGDIVKKVGLWPASFHGIHGITNKMRGKVGKKIRLKLKREGKTVRTSFILRDLI